jgi:hypothetical protein
LAQLDDAGALEFVEPIVAQTSPEVLFGLLG